MTVERRRGFLNVFVAGGFVLLALLAAKIFLSTSSPAKALTTSYSVPNDYPTIQAAVNAATSGDTIIVSPGVYTESVVISGKYVTLASEYLTTGDPATIDQTIIDGNNESGTPITASGTGAAGTKIIGFTLRKGADGIKRQTRMDILNNHITANIDGIDSSAGGDGLIRDNTFDFNRDDGVDFDKVSSGRVEHNVISNNGDDGMEIRLQDYTGPLLLTEIVDNTIEGNGEDGIQIIDYPGLTNREFHIERNLIRTSDMVGLGLMDGGVTIEDYRAASILEPIRVYNNTFSNNPYGITGGDNLIALNNVIANSTVMGIKNIDAGSTVSYTLFWNNAVNQTGSNLDAGTTIYANPSFDTSFNLQSGSPAIDVGTAYFIWNSQVVLNYPAGSYNGTAPDLGWKETGGPIISPTPTATPTATPVLTPTPTPTPVPNDTISPVVSISYPTEGSTIKAGSKLTITALASDNVGVTKVEFYVGGSLKCSDVTSPYSCLWSVSGRKNVVYSLTAKAYDAAGNLGTNLVTVTAK